MRKIFSLILLFAFSSVLFSCYPKFIYDKDKINITITTNIIKDLALNIGGEHVNVYSLMGPGEDPHQYIAKPYDYIALDKADLILVSGLHLEGKMTSIFESFKKRNDKHVLILGDTIIEKSSNDLKALLIEDYNFGGNFDPHFWFDLDLYKEAARFVSQNLILIDPSNEQYYTNNYEKYAAELDSLNFEIINLLNSVSSNNRFLISAHDAFAYFGKKYNFKIKSLQGLSTESEVSPNDIKEIVDLITKHNIKAIFPETSVPIETITSVKEALKRKGYQVTIGENLYSDSLGDKADDNTYIKMYLKNVNSIIDALKGD